MVPRDIALALSGGGYRAAFFHLGVLRKLHELELLDRVGVVSSVSGGSIVAGAFAQALLDGTPVPAWLNATAQHLHRHTLDWPALLSEFLPWQPSAQRLERSFGPMFRRAGRLTRMSDLGGLDGPRFVFNSTAVHSGRGWRFVSGGTVEEWELGQTHDAAFSTSVDRYRCDVTLAKAVTASAAFPLFSAVTIPRAEVLDAPEEAGVDRRQFHQDLPDPVCLSDGGVRDNSGLTSIIVGHRPPGYETDYYLVGSDAGAIVPMLDEAPAGLARLVRFRAWWNANPRGRMRKVRYLLRSFDIMGHHNNRIAVAMILREHRTRTTSMKGVAMLRIDESIIELGEGAETVCDLHSVETRLRSPGWNTAERLMNHGSNLAWARLSEYTDLLTDDQLMPLTKKRRHKDLKPTREVGGG